MSDIKILKAISHVCDLKDERNARIRDSKFNKLVYYDGHIELVKDQIDEVILKGSVHDDDLIDLGMNDLLYRGLSISESTIDNIVMENDCWLHLDNNTAVRKLTCRKDYAEASIRGESRVNQLIVENKGSMHAKHGQINDAHVGRGGKFQQASA